MQVSIENLSNQLKLVFVERPESTCGTVQAWFNAGSALESKDDHGVAHFLEHMFFKGTKKRPGHAIAYEVESMGAEVNAFTSFDYTCYYINSPGDSLLKSLEILLDMISNPSFLQSELESEKEVVFEEYLRSQDSPNQFAFQKIQKNFFSKGYSHPILGSQKHIKSFNRKQIVEFRKKFYNSGNTTLLIAGNFSKAKVLNLVKKFKFPRGKRNDFPEFNLKKKPSINIENKDVEMIQLDLITKAMNFTTESAAVEDLSWSCLGVGESSYLYKNLVQNRSLCNSSSSSTFYFKKNGIHLVRFNLPKENLEKVLEGLPELFNNLKENGFEAQDVERIQNQFIASKVYEKESMEQYAFSLGHSLVQYESLEAEDKFIDEAQQASLKQVNSMIKKLLGQTFHISVLLPEGLDQKDFKPLLEGFSQKLNLQEKSEKTIKRKAKTTRYDLKVKTTQIVPGVQLIHRQNTLTPTFIFHSYLKGGLSDEADKNGIYHLLASNIVNGHSGLNVTEYKNMIETYAASLSGFSGKNAYGLTMHGQTKHFDELMNHFKGTFFNPNFDQTVFEHEKELTIRQIQALKKEPTRRLFGLINKKFFPDHAYSQDVLGTEESLKDVTADHLKLLHEQNVQTKEIVFTYGGPHSFEEICHFLDEHFKELKPREKKSYKPFEIEDYAKSLSFLEMDREQTHLFTGFPTQHLADKKNLYLKILSAYLSGQSSPVFVKLRDEMGLCYTVQPINFSALEAGYWGFYMGTSNDKLEVAHLELQKIIGEVFQKGLSKKEFERVKRSISGQALLALQTNEDYANTYSIPFLHGLGIEYFYKEQNQIDSMTVEKFNQQIKKFSKFELSSFVVGPKNLKET
ncbi:MAG: M16 family metallopeptidase [Bacteriovoracaceae bacterium]